MRWMLDLLYKCEIHTNINAFYHFIEKCSTYFNNKKPTKILAPRRKSNLLFQNYHERNYNSALCIMYINVLFDVRACEFIQTNRTNAHEKGRWLMRACVRVCVCAYLAFSFCDCRNHHISSALHYLTILSDYAGAECSDFHSSWNSTVIYIVTIIRLADSVNEHRQPVSTTTRALNANGSANSLWQFPIVSNLHSFAGSICLSMYNTIW